MYEAFYQLSADPFRLSPDPAFSFQHRTYRKAMTYMLHALHRAEGFVMITGQPGTGKTTLVSDLVSTLSSDQVAVAKIVSTQLSSDDLLNMVAYSFNLDPEGWSKAKVLVQVERFLKQQYQQGRRPLLIVDEAQGMDKDALEELRLLTNMLVDNQQLLQVFLVGQEKLRDTVNTPALEQLQQRLIATTFLEPLDTDDTRAYIKHRLRHVNWRGDPLISTETYAMIQRYSHGIPRRINQICSRLFLHGSTEEKHRLGTADLEVVIEELQQELLLPMDKVSIFDAAPWLVEHDEETYEEELQTAPLVKKNILPTTEFQPETDRSAKPASTRVAETRPRMTSREPVPDAGPGAETDNNHASIHHRKRRWQPKLHALHAVPGSDTSRTERLRRDRIRKTDRPTMWGSAVILLVVMTATLVAYHNESVIVQPVSDQDTRDLSQSGTTQPVQPATVDSEVIAVSTEAAMPTPEEQTDSGTRSNASNISSNSLGGSGAVAVLAVETGQKPVPEFDPIETSPPPPQLTLVDPEKIPAPDTKSDEAAVQSVPGQDTPAPDREAVAVLSWENQAEEATTLAPVNEISAAGPLTKEEKIAELLANGQRSLQRDRLMIPKDDSAYYYFQQVLELDPGNSQVHYGMEQIVARYAVLITAALNRNDRNKAEQYITRGFRISQNDEDLQALRDRMNALPVKIAPESEYEDFFTSFRKYFSWQPNEKIESRPRTDEP